jgi:hypothetical protein
LTTPATDEGTLDGGFVGLELDDRLFSSDRVADADQHLGDVARRDVLSQLWNLELGHL